MINAHLTSRAHSDQPKAVISRPGMTTFWILFATMSVILLMLVGIAISSIPAQTPLTQRNQIWQVRDLADNVPCLAPAYAHDADPGLSPTNSSSSSSPSLASAGHH